MTTQKKAIRRRDGVTQSYRVGRAPVPPIEPREATSKPLTAPPVPLAPAHIYYAGADELSSPAGRSDGFDTLDWDFYSVAAVPRTFGTDGWDQNGYNKYDVNAAGERRGFSAEGWGRNGYNAAGMRRAFSADGWDQNGFNKYGVNAAGDRHTFDEAGYDEAGYDRGGFNRSGWSIDGYDEAGRSPDGYDRRGNDALHHHRTEYDRQGEYWDRETLDRVNARVQANALRSQTLCESPVTAPAPQDAPSSASFALPFGLGTAFPEGVAESIKPRHHGFPATITLADLRTNTRHTAHYETTDPSTIRRDIERAYRELAAKTRGELES